jgi:hypothetical protein
VKHGRRSFDRTKNRTDNCKDSQMQLKSRTGLKFLAG